MRLPLTPLLALALTAPALPATAQQAQQPTAVQQFQHLEDDWSVALVNKDQFALDNLLAPAFINIAAGAQVTTRNQYITDALDSTPALLLSAEQKVVSVRVISDVAIVEGTYIFHLRESVNHVRDERGIFTHVYARNRDTWSCVNSQRTFVVDDIAGAKAKVDKPKKPSDAELPFHLPLLP